ncbi:hypothetical protein ACFVIM_14435 [Streptomyces sp. NPDC057638]|uniref:hypothetical protein n=1 Tax=Streptomyces sp. NPDC057638 TaxID=3346190 RepID=UPI0036BFFB01
MPLTAVYHAVTGHVLGALALTGADTPTGVGAVVGDALPLRVPLDKDDALVTLPLAARDLAVLAADDEPAALDRPLDFGVVKGPEADAVPKPTLLRLADWSDGITLGTTGVTIKLPVATNRVTQVVAVVSDGEGTHVLTGSLVAQQTEVTLPLTLTSNAVHGVLVLAAGWAGRLQQETVT